MRATATTTLKNHPRLLQALVTLASLSLMAMPVLAAGTAAKGP